jgi:7-cyano-7-deazaguanine synthase
MRALILLSGGLDSVTLLYHLRACGYACEALGVWYGQQHYRELAAAEALAAALAVPYDAVRLDGYRVECALTRSVALPDAAPSDPAQRATVVPGRNAVLLSLAASLAESRGIPAVGIACNLDDAAIYADCRPAFLDAIGKALPARLLAPFVYWPKARVVAEGAVLGVPFAATWSCYSAGTSHCGWCGACRTRQAAFERAGVADPTAYAETARV